MGNIGNKSTYAYYCKLSDKTKNNKIEDVKSEAFDVVLDPAEISLERFKVSTVTRDIDQRS